MRWSGKIGFVTIAESSPGIWSETVTERQYYGDLLQVRNQIQNGISVNTDPVLSNKISIVADPYANNNMLSMRYVTFRGYKLKVTSIDASSYPRLTIDIGGVYNDET